MKAVVLGAGFAGLAAAAELARQGLDVTLLEQQPHVGGKASEYRVRGYRFDTGPHLFTLPEIYRSLFTADDPVKPVEMLPLTPLTRYFFPPERTWDVYFETGDSPKTTSGLTDKEATTYLALRNEAKKLFEGAADTFLYGDAPSLWDLFVYGVREGFRAHPLRTLPQLLKAHGASEDLEQFFLRFATYFGADPYRAPAILHNIAWVELGQGAFHPVGGIAAVIGSLRELAEARGVDIRCSTRVTGLQTHNKHISRVQTDQGDVEADVVISALDIIRTSQLLGKTSPLSNLEPSLSGFVMLLGVRGESPNSNTTTSVLRLITAANLLILPPVSCHKIPPSIFRLAAKAPLKTPLRVVKTGLFWSTRPHKKPQHNKTPHNKTLHDKTPSSPLATQITANRCMPVTLLTY